TRCYRDWSSDVCSSDLAISQTSCGVLQKMGSQIQWLHSYVTGDKIYCVYVAPSEAMVREHAKQGGFPANRVSEIKSVIDPTTAEIGRASCRERSGVVVW